MNADSSHADVYRAKRKNSVWSLLLLNSSKPHYDEDFVLDSASYATID